MWLWLWLCAVAAAVLWRWQRERQMVGQLHNRFVLITGCDSDFGHLLATQLDQCGLRVLAACLTERGAERLQREVSRRLRIVLLDVTRPESVRAAAWWAQETVGERGLWGLVNNAGIANPVTPNEWLTKEDFAKVLDVNLLGLIDVTLNPLPLVKRARGRIVNVSSVLGHLSIFAFSDSLRREILPLGVKGVLIEPGHFQTPILDPMAVEDNLRQAWARAPTAVRHNFGQSFLDSQLRRIRMIEKWSNSNLTLVTSCIAHALTSRHPRIRYSAGWDAKLIYLPLSYLPTSLVDQLVLWFLPRREQGEGSVSAGR
uniref:Retinol dehydrogenase 16 n=1 Tax=Ornithorhynchus anatinus TaxID=9258 RepID=A0A6I8NNL9_ORNAN